MMKSKRKRRKMGNVDYGIFYTVMILLAIGVVMVYSASSFYAMIRGDSMSFLKKQVLAAIMGIIAFVIFVRFDYHKLKKFTLPAMIITIPLLFLVFLFEPVNGAQRWIQLGPLSFQPSELAKYVVVLALASVLTAKGEKIKDIKTGVLPCLAIGIFYAGCVLMQKNLSVAAIIVFVTFIMIFSSGAQFKHLVAVCIPVALAGAAAAILEPYRFKRLANFIDPWKDAAGDGYQLIQSFYALGAGGVTGLGLGQSRQKTLYMPEPHNDFIFSIIGEELGLIGCLVILALFIILIWRGFKVAMDARDTYGTLLALGITSVIAVQTIINIAVVTGSMPVTGVPLPFISYGGTSLAITMAAMGILLNISRQSKENLENYRE